jgi:ribonuclease D
VSPAHEVIVERGELDDLVAQLEGCDRYALDTEFHRERTYYPKVALMQIAWKGGLALIDPLAVDLAALRPVLESDALAVLHAADQDLEVLEIACGTGPRYLFDTQIAAGFLGLSTPSLSALHERFLGVRLPKGDRLTDWLHRPLTADQLAYAAADVERLLEIHDRLVGELGEKGRLTWVDDECEVLRARWRGPREPENAWVRLKEVRQLRGLRLAVAQEVAAWREREAQRRDLPPRFVLADLALVAVSQKMPERPRDLRNIRGLDERSLRDGVRDDLLEAVRRGRERGEPWPGPTPDVQLERRLRPAASLVSAWLAQQARDLELDMTTLATRSDIEGYLAGDDRSRLTAGWRHDAVGADIDQLVRGEASLAFGPESQLVLEPRHPA